MPTYIFAEKNSSCCLTLSADTVEEAINELEAHVKFPMAWRLDSEEGD